MFITFEGSEGSGKSTQAKLLHDTLTIRGIPCILTREPGGTPLVEVLRSMVLRQSVTEESWTKESELLLMWAGRAQHWRGVIKPNLDKGITVICDRFYDSTRAYQGYGRGVPLCVIDGIEKLFGDIMIPDQTFIIKGDVAAFLNRAKMRLGSDQKKMIEATLSQSFNTSPEKDIQEDCFEAQDLSFHQRVYDGFMTILRENPNRCVGIEDQEVGITHGKILRAAWNLHDFQRKIK